MNTKYIDLVNQTFDCPQEATASLRYLLFHAMRVVSRHTCLLQHFRQHPVPVGCLRARGRKNHATPVRSVRWSQFEVVLIPFMCGSVHGAQMAYCIREGRKGAALEDARFHTSEQVHCACAQSRLPERAAYLRPYLMHANVAAPWISAAKAELRLRAVSRKEDLPLGVRVTEQMEVRDAHLALCCHRQGVVQQKVVRAPHVDRNEALSARCNVRVHLLAQRGQQS